MSASRTILLASKPQMKEESSEDDYDSEEERYQRRRQRLLKEVEKGAAAIRIITEITKPFVTGAWRLEREEKRERQQKMLKEKEISSEHSLVSQSTLAHENITVPFKEVCAPLTETRDNKSALSRHVKQADASSVLEMEKTPTWKPLRKSKARHSVAQLCTENICSRFEDQIDNQLCTPLREASDFKSLIKTAEETRSPLRMVKSTNQAPGGRKCISFNADVIPVISSSSVKDTTVEYSDNILNAKKCDDDFRSSHEAKECDDEFEVSSVSVSTTETPVSQTHSLAKKFKSPVRFSPVLLQAYGKEHAKVHGSIGSPDKVINLEECTSPKDPSKVLKGVVAYVEVRRGEDDRTGGFRWKLKQLGATVSETLNKKVTHVIFQEGLLSTFRKAKQIDAHIVSTHWVMACDESYTKVPEARYPIEKLSKYELADPLQKTIKRPKIMSPDLGSGRDDKALTRRLRRQSIKVNSPLLKVPAEISTYTTPVIKTPSPVKEWKGRMKIILSPPIENVAQGGPVDDYDGFLAMVEAQVREKAELRRKSGELKEPLDFETRLQMLLGRCNEATQCKDPDPPLAAIFHTKKSPTSTSITPKISPKKVKKVKQSMVTTASSSFMRSWLQGCAPETGKPASAAAAASAAADEILKSMLKCKSNEKKYEASPKLLKNNESDVTDHEVSPAVKSNHMLNDKRSLNNVQNNVFVFTGKSEDTKNKVKHVTNKRKNKNKDFQGREACLKTMRSWLMSVKSPTQSLKCSKSSSKEELDCNVGCTNKRKASSFEEVTCKTDNSKTSKKLCREITPSKCNVDQSCEGGKHTKPNEVVSSSHSSSHVSNSPLNRSGKKSEELPRRRSLRLTPVKNVCLAKIIDELEPVEESTELH